MGFYPLVYKCALVRLWSNLSAPTSYITTERLKTSVSKLGLFPGVNISGAIQNSDPIWTRTSEYVMCGQRMPTTGSEMRVNRLITETKMVGHAEALGGVIRSPNTAAKYSEM